MKRRPARAIHRKLSCEHLESRIVLSATADIVVFVDQSGSLGEQVVIDWYEDLITGVEEFLVGQEIGTTEANRYSLMAFGDGLPSWSGWFEDPNETSIDAVVAAIQDLEPDGSIEDALEAIWELQHSPGAGGNVAGQMAATYRTNAAVHFIVVGDDEPNQEDAVGPDLGENSDEYRKLVSNSGGYHDALYEDILDSMSRENLKSDSGEENTISDVVVTLISRANYQEGLLLDENGSPTFSGEIIGVDLDFDDQWHVDERAEDPAGPNYESRVFTFNGPLATQHDEVTVDFTQGVEDPMVMYVEVYDRLIGDNFLNAAETLAEFPEELEQLVFDHELYGFLAWDTGGTFWDMTQAVGFPPGTAADARQGILNFFPFDTASKIAEQLSTGVVRTGSEDDMINIELVGSDVMVDVTDSAGNADTYLFSTNFLELLTIDAEGGTDTITVGSTIDFGSVNFDLELIGGDGNDTFEINSDNSTIDDVTIRDSITTTPHAMGGGVSNAANHIEFDDATNAASITLAYNYQGFVGAFDYEYTPIDTTKYSLKVTAIDELFEEIGNVVSAENDNQDFDLDGNDAIDEADGHEFRVGLGSRLGDSDLNGAVNAVDLNAVGVHWQRTDVKSWSDGDFVLNDELVNVIDLNVLGVEWLQTNGHVDPQAASLGDGPDAVAAALAVGGFDPDADFCSDGTIVGGIGPNSDVVCYLDFIEEFFGSTFLPGDVDLDGDVDASDLEVITASYLSAPSEVLWSTGDMNVDGVVDWSDISLWMSNRTVGYYADFDDDGVTVVEDIDILFSAIWVASELYYGSTVVGWEHDLNYDGNIDSLDMDYLIQSILGTEYGDANLDGMVDQLDLDIVNLNWQQNVESWGDGDFNGDGFVDVQDFLIVSLNWGFGT